MGIILTVSRAGRAMGNANDEQMKFARIFTKAMHELSSPPAVAWPQLVDLSECEMMLDIGGGSGAHCIGAIKRWPHLRAIIFEVPSVCSAALDYISGLGLQNRIQTHAGDMWQDPYPAADVHFYSWVYYAYPCERRRLLTRKSFQSLEPGGRLILHEMLYQGEAPDSPGESVESYANLLSIEGKRFGQALWQLLEEAGFENIETIPTVGQWSIVTGRKPR